MNLRIALTLLLLVATASCRTVGVSRVKGGYAEVNASVAHEIILDTRQIIVLDLRTPEEYASAHIAGAISTPMATIENRLPELLPYQRSTLLVYGDEHEESTAGARLLVAAGFRNVVRIMGGLPAWIRGGYPTVSSQ
jgi:rhodanese-related sulfurtransferase